jgi:predicted DNA-binding transcriptional regulator YafY
MKNSKISRIMQLLTTLQSSRGYEVSQLAGILGKSCRTIYRDMEELGRAGLSCYFNKNRRCYSLNLQSPLPTPALSKDEALGLLLLLYKARRFFHHPFAHDLLTAGLKIESGLRRDVKQFCDSSLSHISVSPAPQVATDLLDKIFIQLLEAIHTRQSLAVQYYLPVEQRDISTDLNPYCIFYSGGVWHAIGESGPRKNMRTFELNHIRQLTPLDKHFVEDKKFDLKEYFGYAWSLLREGRIYDVKLRFSSRIAAEVAETEWHHTQTVSFENDGSAIFKFRVDGLNEISWWIFGFGDQVQVLAPEELRKRIVQKASRITNS